KTTTHGWPLSASTEPVNTSGGSDFKCAPTRFVAQNYFAFDSADVLLIGFSGRRPSVRQKISLTNNINDPMSLLYELLQFLRARKKLWLLPIILIMLALGGLMVAAKGSILAPFVYTIF